MRRAGCKARLSDQADQADQAGFGAVVIRGFRENHPATGREGSRSGIDGYWVLEGGLDMGGCEWTKGESTAALWRMGSEGRARRVQPAEARRKGVVSAARVR